MASHIDAAAEESSLLQPSSALSGPPDAELAGQVDARMLVVSVPGGTRWHLPRGVRRALPVLGGLVAAAVLLHTLGAGHGGVAKEGADAATHGSGELLREAKEVEKGDSLRGASITRVLPDQGMGFPVDHNKPTLFCWSVMNKDNQAEIEIMKGQLRERIGIFGCDNVAVISGAKINLGNGHRLPNGSHVQVYSWYIPAKPVAMGNFQAGDNTNSFKNTDIFIRAWDALVNSKAIFGHDWTIKADPDCVFFAYRLRWHLRNITEDSKYKPLYLKNCNWKGQPALFGSLEVFSQLALKRYAERGHECLNLDWQHWGEDQWIDTCMWQKLGGIDVHDWSLVGDHRCMSAECEDTWRAAFHDYKSWWSYKDCWDRSRSAEKMKAMAKDSSTFCCTYSWDRNDPCNKCGSRVRPGEGFCGSNKGSCEGCGAKAHWCKRVGSGAKLA